MYAQVVKFSLPPANREAFDALVSAWASGPAKQLAGAQQVTVSHELGGTNRVSVLIEFADQSALERFSADRASLEFFERAKPLITGSLRFFDAITSRVELSDR